MANKRIILTADDYGAMSFIDNAIIECIKAGKINCVSCFVCFPTSHQRILELKELQQQYPFAIGLHFSVTAGFPLLRQPNSLSESKDGQLQFLDARHYPFWCVKEADLEAELEEQIRVLGEWLGGVEKIDHLSNHHGVMYVDDQFFTLYSAVAQRHGIPIRSPRIWSQSGLSYYNDRFHLLNPLTRYGVYHLQWIGERKEAMHFEQKVLEAADKHLAFPYCNNDCIYGLWHEDNLQNMINNYHSYDMSTEFMFHLGYFNTDFDEPIDEPTPNGIDSGYFTDRRHEFDLLRNYNLDNHFDRAGVTRAVYRDLTAGGHERTPQTL